MSLLLSPPMEASLLEAGGAFHRRAEMPDPVGPVQEYETLRQELRESTRYVFERPLLILTAGVAGLNALKTEYLTLVPAGLSILILFNLWFTINRLFSAARIIAYIQLVIEEYRCGSWKGWETCLREYRLWTNVDWRTKRAMIKDEVNPEAFGTANMYYVAIYLLHVGLMLISIAGSIALAEGRSQLSQVCLGVTLLLGAWFGYYCLRYRPSYIRTLIERNRAIWTHVLKKMAAAAVPGPPPQAS